MTARRALTCMALLACLLPVPGESVDAGERVLIERQSRYNTVRVTEDERGLRAMYFGAGRARQTVVKPDDPDHLEAPYVAAMPVALVFVPRPQRMLVVGLGGGVIPAFLHRKLPELRIDAVELDPVVLELARSHFGFRDDDRMRAFVSDGRRFIEQSRDRYDIVLLDAYGSDSVPHALTTREFLAGVRNVLADGGVVVGNLWGRDDNMLYDAMMRTYREVFADVHVLDIPRARNKLVFASAGGHSLSHAEAVSRAREITAALQLRDDLGVLVARGLRRPGADGRGAVLLTDREPPDEPGKGRSRCAADAANC